MKKEVKEEKKSENEKTKKSFDDILFLFAKGILEGLEIWLLLMAMVSLGGLLFDKLLEGDNPPFSFKEWWTLLSHFF